MEWVFGLPRGGLSYYLKSQENGVCFRADICQMYARGDFVLAPTFRLYMDAMDFIQHAGLINRNAKDKSPRRPLTSMASPEGLYRYVFIPRTDEARALQEEFGLPLQAEGDLHGDTHPIQGIPFDAGVRQLRIVECYAHPFSVSTFASQMLWNRTSKVSGQYHCCTGSLVDQWRLQRISPPQWFVDELKHGSDDVELTPSEATGYLLCIPQAEASAPEPVHIPHDTTIDDDDYRQRVSVWAFEVDPKSKPETEPPRSPLQLRRSDRLREKACPYASPSPQHCATPLSPPRRVPPALRYRDPLRRPPAWTKRNGGFPTPRFCSNDWAYFRYRVALNAPRVT
ncbi:hypothetical protein BD626DRAFT_538274 [Schizophyllum amplum]|uniref:Uncharacterized protein n=1 Tax=Schizophyllum amplum TaxID=97359 RepID=A0A550C970_9AGAR|nr:hypothetical protein BD626DRAFT_538274 [Auriculariopsis ampla]